MARIRRSSRSSRRSSGSRFSTRRRSNRPTRSRRYTVRRRRGRVGIRAEVKYVGSIRGRLRAVDTFANDTDFGPLFLAFLPTAGAVEPHDYGIWADDAAVKDIGAASLKVAQMSSYGMLLTHCRQGFEPQRRIGLAINPRSLIVRINCTAGMRMSTTAAAANFGEDAEAGIPQADLDARQRLNATQSGIYVRTAIRFIVFRAMEPGTYVAVNEIISWRDIFQVGANAPPSVSDFLNPAQVGRFHIVNDFTVNLDHNTPQKNLSIRVPVAKVLRYGGAEGNNIRAGHYFLMACAESNMGYIQTAAGSPLFVPPVVLYQHRMAYTDS